MAATIKEVAKLAGVSPGAVSLVTNKKHKGQISEETRAKILQAAKKLNYLPSPYGRGLKLKRSETIGYIVPFFTQPYLSDPYFHETITTIEKEARKYSYSLLFFTFSSEEEERKLFEITLKAVQIDGLLLSTPPLKDKYFPKLKKENFPVVLMGKYPTLNDISCVDVDNVKAGYMGTEHLIKLGRKKICYISGPPGLWNVQERLKGYKKALKENGIEIDPRLIKSGDYSIESGYYAFRDIIDMSGIPDGIIAHNDSMAIGAMDLIKERELRIPQDVAVVGFNNTYFSQNYDPPLTVVDIPAAALASKAVEMLVKKLNGNGEKEEKIILGCELIIRKSSNV